MFSFIAGLNGMRAVLNIHSKTQSCMGPPGGLFEVAIRYITKYVNQKSLDVTTASDVAVSNKIGALIDGSTINPGSGLEHSTTDLVEVDRTMHKLNRWTSAMESGSIGRLRRKGEIRYQSHNANISIEDVFAFSGSFLAGWKVVFYNSLCTSVTLTSQDPGTELYSEGDIFQDETITETLIGQRYLQLQTCMLQVHK